MTFAEMVLPEFDQEMASTRKVLERIPQDKLDWQPHPKSHTIGWNANHLANLPEWLVHTMGKPAAGYRSGGWPAVCVSETGQSSGNCRNVRPECRSRTSGAQVGNGRRHGRYVDVVAGRESDLQHAQVGGCAGIRHQPHYPSSRNLVRLPPLERHPGPRHVRSVGRRIKSGTRPLTVIGPYVRLGEEGAERHNEEGRKPGRSSISRRDHSLGFECDLRSPVRGIGVLGWPLQ